MCWLYQLYCDYVWKKQFTYLEIYIEEIYTREKEKSYHHFFTSLFIISLSVSISLKSNLVLVRTVHKFSIQKQQLFHYKKIIIPKNPSPKSPNVLNDYLKGTVLNILHASFLLSSQSLYGVGTITITILQMKKLSTKLSNKLCDGGIKSFSLNSNLADSRAHTEKIL